MLSIPAELIAKKNALYQSGAVIELLEIQISESAQTLRLTSNDEDVEWSGYTWTRFPFRGGEVSESSDGDLPRLDVQVSNVSRVMQGYIEQTENGLVGDTVIYRLVHSNHLDQDPYLTETFEIVGTRCDVVWVTFTLGAENFLFRRFPLNTFKRNVCRWRQFKGTQCGYMGAATTCDRKLSTCIGYANEARYGGFPGLLDGFFDV
jgi:phage-related protein